MGEESIGCVVSWQSEVGFGAFCELYPTPKEAAEAIAAKMELHTFMFGVEHHYKIHCLHK